METKIRWIETVPFKKTTYIAGSWEIIKCDIDNAPKNDVTYL